MSRRILTRYGGRVLNLLQEDGKIVECSAFPEEEKGIVLSGVYTARVDQVVPRIRSAFLSVGEEKLFMSLQDNPDPLWCGSHGDKLKAGDEILVQVQREAIGSKEACADCHISLNGRYVVVMRREGRGPIHFSRKIDDNAWKKETQAALLPLLGEEEAVSFLVRTNAYSVPSEEIVKEAESLLSSYARILRERAFRQAGSCLYRPMPEYIRLIRDTPASALLEVVSDDAALLSEAEALRGDPAFEAVPFRLYDDRLLPLTACYGIGAALERAQSRLVWMKSGAFITIEQTEALTAVDVNSGKAVKGYKDDLEKSFLAINMEAAGELMAQLRLRNISGMILADFINMKEKEDEERLLQYLSALAREDPVRTIIVDITKLGLVEITRKKVRDTLDKQLHS